MTGGVVAELPTVLTTAELCERWRCTPRTLERMARDGRIRRLKLRGGVRYPTDEVLRIERGEDRLLAGAPDAAPAAVAVSSGLMPPVLLTREPLPPSPLPRARGRGRAHSDSPSPVRGGGGWGVGDLRTTLTARITTPNPRIVATSQRVVERRWMVNAISTA